MQDTIVPARYGRVTRATIDRLWAECFERNCAPPLGELVAVEDSPGPIYAVVSAAVTEGVDPGRRLLSHGGPLDDLEHVLAENPHVPKLLTTTFEANVVGFVDGGRDGFGSGEAAEEWGRSRVRQYLPPRTAPILARVRACEAAEREAFMASLDFLKLLLAAGPLADDVVAAALRRAAGGRADGRAFLVRAGKALTPLLATDPTRLQAILRRLQP